MNGDQPEQIHFITGKLAEASLRRVVRELTDAGRFGATIQVMPITVAALMTPRWIARHLEVPGGTTRIILPGYCEGDCSELQQMAGAPIESGPKDLRRLPEYFDSPADRTEFGAYDIEVVAEINHCPRLTIQQIVDQATRLANDGADIIDVGCDPGHCWTEVGDCIGALKQKQFRVSIDSMQSKEIARATAAGAELVLSVNSSNRNAAVDWGAEVVVIPDEPGGWQQMEETIEWLAARDIPLRVDPILEPIGLGFTESLLRYAEARRRWPEAELLMGIGNVTELTDVDSAGINVILLAICQELGIRSVLTTQVINWARSAVKECHLARQLVYFACRQQVPPKNVDHGLVVLRDAYRRDRDAGELDRLAGQIRDWNYRLFADRGEVHALGGGRHFHSTDAFEVFDQLLEASAKPLTPSHAFYLGYEMCKATVALVLGKEYSQDDALNWGFLTADELDRHRLARRSDNDQGQ